MNNGKIDEFLKTQKSKVVINIFNKIRDLGFDDNFLDMNSDEIEKIIIDLKPTSVKSITTICSIISSYAKYIGNSDGYRKILKISSNRHQLWEDKIKINAPKKYISHKTYVNMINEIPYYDENNALYYKTLISIIYEGIYCDDMSVIINLTISDINGDVVTLHNSNGYSYKIELPHYLINDLEILADDNLWYRENSKSRYKIKIYGKYEKSCFKKECRKSDNKDDDLYRTSYYNKLRSIMKKCLGYTISPTQLFVSGIMYRICLELKSKNITLENAFLKYNKDEIVANIIKKELSRCEYEISVNAFRELVIGHLEIFEDI